MLTKVPFCFGGYKCLGFIFSLQEFFEIVWAVALKYADGFSNWFYSAVTIIGMVASVYFLAVAMRTIPLGTLTPFGPVSGVLAPLLPAFSCLEKLSLSPELFSLRLSPSESLA